MVDPRTLPCPACNAQAGEPCSQPTNTSRKPVNWHHLIRESHAQEEYERNERDHEVPDEKTPVNANGVLADLRGRIVGEEPAELEVDVHAFVAGLNQRLGMPDRSLEEQPPEEES